MIMSCTGRLQVVLLVPVLAILTSCSKDISRGQAGRLISQSESFTKNYNALNWREGSSLEVWASQGGMNNPKLKAAVSMVTSSEIVFRKQFTRKLDNVTGIADLPLPGATGSFKEADFTWSYEGLPSIAKRFSDTYGTGKAYLRRYDDGWRVENLGLQSLPSDLNADERTEIERDRETERGRRGLAERTHQQQIAERAAVLRAALKESKQATRDLGVFETVKVNWGGNITDVSSLRLTDVSVTYKPYVSARGTDGRPLNEITVWFGCLNGNIDAPRGTPTPGIKAIEWRIRIPMNGAQDCPESLFGEFNTRDEHHQKQIQSAIAAAYANWVSRYGQKIKELQSALIAEQRNNAFH
jgi:hypothetical protein